MTTWLTRTMSALATATLAMMRRCSRRYKVYCIYNSRSNVVLKESPKNNNVLLSPVIESIRISVVVVKTINGK
jgi:hypothetical protein